MKIYYKEYIPIFLFQTFCFLSIFVVVWFGSNHEVDKQIVAWVTGLGWIICTIYLIKQVRFKKIGKEK